MCAMCIRTAVFNRQVKKQNRFLVGRYEETEYLIKKNLHSEISPEDVSQVDDARNRIIQRSSSNRRFNILWRSFETYKYIIDILKAQSRHASCPHPYSCAHYILAVRIMISKYSRDIFFDNAFNFVFFYLKG